MKDLFLTVKRFSAQSTNLTKSKYKLTTKRTEYRPYNLNCTEQPDELVDRAEKLCTLPTVVPAPRQVLQPFSGSCFEPSHLGKGQL